MVRAGNVPTAVRCEPVGPRSLSRGGRNAIHAWLDPRPAPGECDGALSALPAPRRLASPRRLFRAGGLAAAMATLPVPRLRAALYLTVAGFGRANASRGRPSRGRRVGGGLHSIRS